MSEDKNEFHYWKCLECNKQINHEEFLKHLEKKHGVNSKITKSTREVLHHIDADTWYEWAYEWNIANLKFVEVKREERIFEDIALWRSI